jgi:hypothetical protein
MEVYGGMIALHRVSTVTTAIADCLSMRLFANGRHISRKNESGACHTLFRHFVRKAPQSRLHTLNLN